MVIKEFLENFLDVSVPVLEKSTQEIENEYENISSNNNSFRLSISKKMHHSLTDYSKSDDQKCLPIISCDND